MTNAASQNVLLLSSKKTHLFLVNSLLSVRKISFLHASSEKELFQFLTSQNIGLILWDIESFYHLSDILGKEIQKHASDAIHIILSDRRKLKKININDTMIPVYSVFDMSQDKDILMHCISEGIEKYILIKENNALHLLIAKKDKKVQEMNNNVSKKLSALNSYFEEKHKTLQRRNHRLKRGIRSTVEVFSSLTDIRNGHPNHCRNVAYLCRLSAEAMSLKDAEINTIEVAALLHDIGKVAIDESIVKKTPGKRNSQEEKHIRMHPVRGQAVVECIDGFKEVGKIIRHHHERYDGKGYPDNLRGREIPLGSRIIAIADRIDNVANSLKRWDKYSLQRALWSVEMRNNNYYDPEVYKVMATVIHQWLRTLMTRGKDDGTLYFIDEFIKGTSIFHSNTSNPLMNILRNSDFSADNYSDKNKHVSKHKTAKTQENAEKDRVVTCT